MAQLIYMVDVTDLNSSDQEADTSPIFLSAGQSVRIQLTTAAAALYQLKAVTSGLPLEMAGGKDENGNPLTGYDSYLSASVNSGSIVITALLGSALFYGVHVTVLYQGLPGTPTEGKSLRHDPLIGGMNAHYLV